MPQPARAQFDLKERTAHFGEAVIEFAQTLPNTAVTRPLITQLVKAATSIGANYCEADDAESRIDFHHKIGICKKESSETVHFLRMIRTAVPNAHDQLVGLSQEAQELHLIFNKIFRNSQ